MWLHSKENDAILLLLLQRNVDIQCRLSEEPVWGKDDEFRSPRFAVRMSKDSEPVRREKSQSCGGAVAGIIKLRDSVIRSESKRAGITCFGQGVPARRLFIRMRAEGQARGTLGILEFEGQCVSLTMIASRSG